MKQSKNKSSRRQFVETSLSGVTGLALGMELSKILDSVSEDNNEVIRMLTADGNLVEVDKRHLITMCGKPRAVSNEELLKWMQNSKS